MSETPAQPDNGQAVPYVSDNSVVIPCDPKDFGSFISGLLGKPQSIARRIKGPYEVTKENISNLHALIMQRILIQNDSSLVQFSVSTSYSDGSTVRLNSIDDFISYAEIKPLISTSISVDWTFLVKFPSRSIPEKQHIGVSFLTFREYEDDNLTVEYDYMHRFSPDSILLKIAHTDRTWGADIENLVSNHLRGYLTPDPNWRKQIQKHANLIGTALGGLISIGAIVAVVNAASDTSQKLDHIVQTNRNDLEGKIETTLMITTLGVWEKFTLYSIGFVTIGIIASIIVAIYATSTIEKARRSYVLINKLSKDHRDIEIDKRNRGLLYLLGCGLLTIFLGVMSNYAFGFATKLWSH